MKYTSIRAFIRAAAPLALLIAFSAKAANHSPQAGAEKAAAAAKTAAAQKAAVKPAAVQAKAASAKKTAAAGAAKKAESPARAGASEAKAAPAGNDAVKTASAAAATAKVVISSAAAENPAAGLEEGKKKPCGYKKQGFCPFKGGSYKGCPKKGGGFFSFYAAGEWTPYDYFSHDKSEVILGYGRHVFRSSSSLEIHFRLTSEWNAGFGVKGEQDLMSDVSWTPGVDVSISAGSMDNEAAGSYSLAPRFGAGVYVKTRVSRALALSLRGGVSYEFAVDSEELASLDNLNVDLSVGIRKYFRF